MRKTYEEKLWDWLLKNLGMDARKVYDYVIRLNKKPRKVEFFEYSKHFPVKKEMLTNDTKPLRVGVKKP